MKTAPQRLPVDPMPDVDVWAAAPGESARAERYDAAATPPEPPPPAKTARASGEPPYSLPPPQLRSSAGQKRMIWMTGAGMMALAIFNHLTVPGAGPLWRLFVAIALFLYLWWLASLLFDLVFVWHRYVQSDAAMEFLRNEVAPKYGQASGSEEPPDADFTIESVVPIPPSTPCSGNRPPPRCAFCGTNKS